MALDREWDRGQQVKQVCPLAQAKGLGRALSSEASHTSNFIPIRLDSIPPPSPSIPDVCDIPIGDQVGPHST